MLKIIETGWPVIVTIVMIIALWVKQTVIIETLRDDINELKGRCKDMETDITTKYNEGLATHKADLYDDKHLPRFVPIDWFTQFQIKVDNSFEKMETKIIGAINKLCDTNKEEHAALNKRLDKAEQIRGL